MNILSIKNISKKYEKFILDDITMDIPHGVIVGLIGENGAGKTTLIKLILDLIEKDNGTIEIFGQNLENMDRIYFNDIGVVFDDKVLPDELTSVQINNIMKNIYSFWDEKYFYEMLEKFSLDKNKKIKELSKGMYMKLAISRALAHKPKLLILDEPTSGLDPISRDDILNVLLDFIQNEENTVILSSHITSDLDKITDYIAYIQDGKLTFFKSKNELCYSYKMIKCTSDYFEKIEKNDIIKYQKTENGYKVLINTEISAHKYENMVIDNVNIEDIMLIYKKGE